MTDTVIPPALAERRAKLVRHIEAADEQILEFNNRLRETHRGYAEYIAELRGIDMAIEEFARSDTDAAHVAAHMAAAQRRPRRDIRAMVKAEVDRQRALGGVATNAPLLAE